MQLLVHKWLVVVEDGEQKKLAITADGLNFLEKWQAIQKVVGLNGRRKTLTPLQEIKPFITPTQKSMA